MKTSNKILAAAVAAATLFLGYHFQRNYRLQRAAQPAYEALLRELSQNPPRVIVTDDPQAVTDNMVYSDEAEKSRHSRQYITITSDHPSPEQLQYHDDTLRIIGRGIHISCHTTVVDPDGRPYPSNR